jgi:hypothetical protein
MNRPNQKAEAVEEEKQSLGCALLGLILFLATAASILRFDWLIVTSPVPYWLTIPFGLFATALFMATLGIKDRAVIWLSLLFVTAAVTPVLQRAKNVAERRKARDHPTLAKPTSQP